MTTGGWFVCQFCDGGVPKDETVRANPCKWCDGAGRIFPQPESAATRVWRETVHELAPMIDGRGFSVAARDALVDVVRKAIERTETEAVREYRRAGHCDCACGGCVHACMKRGK